MCHSFLNTLLLPSYLRMKPLCYLSLLFFSCLAHAQTNVRAWYADGQVWVVWEASDSLPETFAVYAKPTTFNNTDQAVLLGRLFKQEYGPFFLRQQIDPQAYYRIPNGQGGIYQLADNEGLFVLTPHQAGQLWFAVAKWGETAVVTGVNITDAAIPFQYNPVGDPVECHLQKSWISSPGFVSLAFYLWADGRQNQWENRPDFPVMANAAKNGMPCLFIVSGPTDLDTVGRIPATIWLGGFGSKAIDHTPEKVAIVNLMPEKGILVSHNDHLFGYALSQFDLEGWSTIHFGWRKNYNPFSTDNAPVAPDTVINYIQRRYIWVDEWLVRNFNVDPHHININGHSKGAKGAFGLAKAFPDHFASATGFNNGYREHDPPTPLNVLTGPDADNYPTNLFNRDGNCIGYAHFMNPTDRNAQQRDLPFLRTFNAKNDTDSGSNWDNYMVSQFREADSIGWGMQLYWGQRSHGINTGPDYNDHWHNGNNPTQQTLVDNVAYEETHFRSDVSFPAFFNHRLDPQNNDPGDGTPGTGPNGVGDDWGAWGGYHRWDWDNIIDLSGGWSTQAWLESNAVFANDNCPNNSLTADVAIRKPQQFKPLTGKTLNWSVKDLASGNTLQAGQTLVQSDNLVVIPKVVVFRENSRRVRISVTDPSVAITEPLSVFSGLKIEPNPSMSEAMLSVFVAKDMELELKASNLEGQQYSVKAHLFEGENRLPMTDFDSLPAGFYFVSISFEGFQQVIKWVKL